MSWMGVGGLCPSGMGVGERDPMTGGHGLEEKRVDKVVVGSVNRFDEYTEKL